MGECDALCARDLQRLGELQTELAGAADFCATYLHCQLLLIKVGLCLCLISSYKSEHHAPHITSSLGEQERIPM